MKLNKELWTNRKIVFSMGLAEFKNEYIGSAIGGIWGIIKPFIMVLIYSLVFAGKLDNGTPYFIWIIPGLFLWTFLSESLLSGTNAIRENSHLVQKVVFPVSILPAVKVLKNSLNHIVFMILALIILLVTKQPFHIQMIQVIYYYFASVIFTLGITRLFSAMAVMSIDIVHFLSTFMQLLFWASPVVWGVDQPREFLMRFLPILKLNPYYYLIQGYRDSFFSTKWFFQDVPSFCIFWGITLIIYLIGSSYFEKNRKEFADVL